MSTMHGFVAWRRMGAPCKMHHGAARAPHPRTPAGGPGFPAPRPHEASGWLKSATSGFRVILMDQRGTGKSSPITVNNLAKRGGPAEQAQYLSFFRADDIVKASVCIG
jgi:pimeloyl-ACP methyl ester carboxylesterase